MRKRTSRMEVRLTPEEKKHLAEKARQASLPMGEFIRKAVTGTDVREAPPVDVPQLIREIRRVGQNINQLLIIANNYGPGDTELLEATLSEVHTALDSVVSAYTEKGEKHDNK